MKFAEALKAARKGGLSVVAANRLRELAESFASPEAFFASAKGPVMAQWQRLHPDAKRDLGSRFWQDFESVRVLLAAPESPEPEPEPAADPLGKVVTAADLKALGDVMEISGMKEISLREMIFMLETIAARRKEVS